MDLARAVESVGNCLVRLDRADEAVAARHERLAIVRRHTTPGSRGDEALPASARAVAVARPVADANRDHRFILALALSTFAQVRVAAGRDLPAALEAAEESLRGYTMLAGELPAKYGPALERARATAMGLRAAVG
jgi:hypothetical protein